MRKIIYFYTLPQLLASSTAMVRYVPIPSSRLACELILFDRYDRSWVHLGLEKDPAVPSYYPRSFFVERAPSSAPSRFIDGQPFFYAVLWRHRYDRQPKRDANKPRPRGFR
ncbi:hypothetical protein [Paenibacillus sp. B01]|uniref:hypothetical protein n=1 Tax=Paenibacillus sp. B01 TaxID=2660554 RepID=UPI00129BC82F|nr:hypothetical protein [Paenibacillus sp. B01]QGG54200.1 hypothetical protein GE073_00245 [Paenibacillus sp. B01]